MLKKSLPRRILGALCLSVLPALAQSSVEDVAGKLSAAYGQVQTLQAEGRAFECVG